MGGIIPNKEAGITPGLLFAVSNPAGTSYNLSDPQSFGGLTERLGFRNQPNVVELLKSTVKQMPEWQQATTDVFGGLRRGTPGNPLSLPLALAEMLIKQITGTDINFSSFTHLGDVVTTWRVNLMNFLGGLNPLAPGFDPGEAAQAFVTMVLGDLSSLLGGVIPVGGLSSVAPNRMPNPTFTADAIAPGATDWSVDMTNSRTVGDGTGAAHVLADGTRHTLVTGKNPLDRIPVGPGQNVPAYIYVSHYGAVADPAGPPVALQAQPYNGDTALAPVDIATYTPATSSLAWPGTKIMGTYVVPDTGVDSVQFEIDVREQALQGDWWFDDGDTHQAADMSVIPGLPGTLQLFKSNEDALLNGIESVASGVPVFGATIATAMEALKAFNPANIGGSQGGSNLPGDFGSIIDALVGGFKGHAVSGSSTADLYSAASQASTNVANTDVTTNLDISGTFPIQSWANWLDLAGVAKGQDGQAGNLLEFGQGGQPGKFGATMWHRGVDFDSGVTTVTFTVNSNGSITFSIPAGTATTAKSMTIAAGSGTQSPHFGSGYTGIGLGNQMFNSGTFACGGNQSSPGANGIGPGGGGAGSLFGPGGKGAGPRGWCRQRANAVTGQVTGYDTVAPTTPTPHFFAASNSVLTVYGTGSTDTDSGFAGYNFYVRVAGVDTKQNDTPIAEGVHFDITALTPNTDYQASLFITATDNAGNETAKVSFAGTGAITLNPTPATSPMPTDKATAIRAIVAACMAAGDSATGVTIAIRSPFGYMDESFGSGTGVNLHYLNASQTKMLTAYKIAMLIDAGLLHLDDHLSTLLPGYPADPTIQQMLQMQSGLFDYESAPSLGQNFTITPTMAYSVDQIISIIKAGGTGPSVFVPGTSYFYTNSAYYVLGKIIEAVDPTHRPYDQIIKEDIFTPLGMVNSQIRMAIGPPPSPYATGQDFDPILSIIYGLFGGLLGPAPRRDVSSQNPAFIWAAGAWDSVISDNMLFAKELRDMTLLSSTMRNLRNTIFVEEPAAPPYGLKFQGPPTYGHGLGILRIGSWIGHDGSWLGYDSCTMVEPHTGTIISVYENFQTGAPHVLAALSTVWYEIASYLLPGSTNYPGYLSNEAETGTMMSSLPKVTMTAEGVVYDVGSFQPTTQLYTSGALASVTGASPPTGWAASGTGVYVKGIGKGGNSGSGSSLNTGGGEGGAGAAGFDEVFIPKANIGATFDAIYGAGGSPDTIFRTAGIEMKAGGAVGGTPGVCTMTGITGVTTYSGAAPGADSTGPAGAGGGHGGQSSGFATYNGDPGGSSATVPGGAANSGVPADAAALEGGAGGGGGLGNGSAYGSTGGTGAHGGKYGGGAGGGGSGWDGAGGGNVGGVGGLQLRWA